MRLANLLASVDTDEDDACDMTFPFTVNSYGVIAV